MFPERFRGCGFSKTDLTTANGITAARFPHRHGRTDRNSLDSAAILHIKRHLSRIVLLKHRTLNLAATEPDASPYNQSDATGFIRLSALQLKAPAQGKESGDPGVAHCLPACVHASRVSGFGVSPKQSFPQISIAPSDVRSRGKFATARTHFRAGETLIGPTGEMPLPPQPHDRRSILSTHERKNMDDGCRRDYLGSEHVG
jgi:hypothetical protein